MGFCNALHTGHTLVSVICRVFVMTAYKYMYTRQTILKSMYRQIMIAIYRLHVQSCHVARDYGIRKLRVQALETEEL